MLTRTKTSTDLHQEGKREKKSELQYSVRDPSITQKGDLVYHHAKVNAS